MTEAELFTLAGQELSPDPATALRPVKLPPFSAGTGPYYKVQYVIELVGKGVIPASGAMQLLDPAAKSGMGDADIYVMVPGQKRWRLLWSGDDAPGYDSLAFCWDLATSRGRITVASARELLKRCEDVGMRLGRRAMALPPPDEAAAAAENLANIRDSLDIGVDAAVQPFVGDYEMMPALKAAYSLGFRLGHSGLLEWRQQGWPEALLGVYPLGAVVDFEPRKAPALPAMGVGFSVPASPDPEAVLERLFQAAEGLVKALGGVAMDDEGEELSEERRAFLRANMRGALEQYARIGLVPGSPEALRLFEP